ncbi:hypothetical protein Tco_1212936 [Tanacetum coccineum]
MMEGINGEFHFKPEGDIGDGKGSSPYTRSVNNGIPVIDVDPLNSAPPSKVAENIRDSNDASLEKGVADKAEKVCKLLKATGKRKQIAEPSGKETRHKLQKVPPQASKVVGDASDPLDVDSDPDIHEFPSAKELKDFTDCHWTRKLISTTTKARSSCNTIWEREREKDKACAEHEKKSNDALQNLDKNPFVLDMHVEIATLQGQVDRLHNKYSKLVLEEKKWVNYEQTLSVLHLKVKGLESETERLKSFKTQLMQEIDGLRQDRAMFRGRCTTFEEVAALKEPFDLEMIPGYRSSSKKELD